MPVDISELIEQLEEFAVDLRDAAVDDVMEMLRDACPVSPENPLSNLDHVHMRDTLEIFETSDDSPLYTAAVGTDAPYAQFTDEIDTGEHEIRGNPLLRFWWENAPNLPPGPDNPYRLHGADLYYFRKVTHPGTQGQHWFEQPMPQRWDDALNMNVDRV